VHFVKSHYSCCCQDGNKIFKCTQRRWYSSLKACGKVLGKASHSLKGKHQQCTLYTTAAVETNQPTCNWNTDNNKQTTLNSRHSNNVSDSCRGEKPTRRMSVALAAVDSVASVGYVDSVASASAVEHWKLFLKGVIKSPKQKKNTYIKTKYEYEYDIPCPFVLSIRFLACPATWPKAFVTTDVAPSSQTVGSVANSTWL